MAFDAGAFFQHYSIDYIQEGHKHCRPGWIQTRCPFCIGNDGWHLGYSAESDWWNCWRCGSHNIWQVVVGLLNDDRAEAAKALIEFKGRPTVRRSTTPHCAADNRVLELPPSLTPLSTRAKRYLKSRKFDPDMLGFLWQLQSTSNIGYLKYRIFIPIYVDNRMVSWQCRDTTGLSGTKYIAQKEALEIVNNKNTLYGLDHATGKTCVVVEGVSDVWRLGPGAVAVFGIKYRAAQVRTLISSFEEFHILFDSEPQARVQANALAGDLASLGGRVLIHSLEDGAPDPGDFSQRDADTFMKQVFKRS